jgi:hypothetical protein
MRLYGSYLSVHYKEFVNKTKNNVPKNGELPLRIWDSGTAAREKRRVPNKAPFPDWKLG